MELSHLDDAGRPRMVDVGAKEETDRVAEAEGRLRLSAEALAALQEGTGPKGDPLVVAQIAGIQAAKRTADLIPLCHPLQLTSVNVQITVDSELPAVVARSRVAVRGRTGVEMEAITAVAVALLTVYDMLKAVDRGMQIEAVRVIRKEGGRSGTWTASED